ncbi:MAG: pyridoxal phosphate-dependent aminotransferase [Bradymonadales bacterium]|nr:pyridoxal phosphate-dependent aminotransferase [Bradymonadales bacterium]
MPISAKVKEFMSRGSWIRRMFEHGTELIVRHGAENVYDFSLGNPCLEPPQPFVDSLKDLATNPTPGMHRYMPNAGYPEVREKIAKALSKEHHLTILPTQVVMTVGAACALNITLKSLLDPGDEVIVLAPFFAEYEFYIDNHGGVMRLVQSDDRFLPDIPAIRSAISPRTRAIIINTPNNPSGVVYPRAVLEDLAELLEKASDEIGHPIYVLTDEPYRKLVYGAPAPSTLSIFTNCVFCTSHSKDLGLPGERIGMAVVHPRAADATQLLNAMTFTIRTLGFVNAPALMQRAVADLQEVTVDVQAYRTRRDLLFAGLMEAGYECILPEGTFYLFPKSPNPDDQAFIQRLLEERILAVPGSGFGRPGYFRLAYCVPVEVIEKALPGLKRAFQACR